MSDKINNGEQNTGSAESVAPLHNLSAEQLDAISGGTNPNEQARLNQLQAQQKQQDNRRALDELRGLQQILLDTP